MSRVDQFVAALLAMSALAGCQTKRTQALDGAVLWEASGCAFIAHANAGDTMWLTRITELDKPGCRNANFSAVKP
jgi:DNA polymerase IIIc chi subunit